ncbi:hypothetical protein [Bradyrhizobium sp. USDA 241]|uniref:hypothetical protein n=1 Tax=Bradyrhizobium sp. USDA 241 TaxID=3377725 RepID=UPI003C761DA2
MKSSEVGVLQNPGTREINPRFRNRLPQLMRRVCDILVKIEPEIQDLAVHLKEFQEYLDFEIEKVRLAIQKEEWKDRADRAKLDADKEWLAKLEALRTDFNIDAMTAPATLIRSLFARTKDLFGGVSQD